jgi:two-component sensor histidine kinase
VNDISDRVKNLFEYASANRTLQTNEIQGSKVQELAQFSQDEIQIIAARFRR